jgi:hypothetical protein
MMRTGFVVLVLLISLFAAHPVSAGYSDCGPYQPPSGACRQAFVNNETVIVAPGRAFAWLRIMPSSTARPVYTAPVGMLLLIHKSGPEPLGGFWDGHQWWFEVFGYPPSRGHGWVEQASLYPVGQGMPQTTARIRRGIPFVWIRLYPSSYSQVLTTIFAGRWVTVLGSPMANQGQNWLNVRYSTGTKVFQGYIEQSAVQ